MAKEKNNQEEALDHLPEEVRDALLRIYGGECADRLETQTLDFKEDPARLAKEHGNPQSELINIVLNESVCMANGNSTDSYIVIGVNDKATGQAAFSGTSCNPQMIRSRIFNNTVPPLAVDITQFTYAGQNLLCIRIPEPLAVYSKKKGELTKRVGTSCVPMTSEDRKRLEWERINPDYTAKPARMSRSGFQQLAIDEARRLLSIKAQTTGDLDTPRSDLDVLRTLGLIDRDGKTTYAAEILFAAPQDKRVAVRHLYHPVPGAEAVVQELETPLVMLFGAIQQLINKYSSQEIVRVNLENGQEIPVPAFPKSAVDEVVANALLHRDWTIDSPITIRQTARTLSVTSPGSLPPNVDETKILTTTSVPRNPCLMKGVRILGLAEESSRGFDRMWASMLSTGRRAPIVEVTDFSVNVTLEASNPDTDFIVGLAKLAKSRGGEFTTSVNSLIILRHLADDLSLSFSTARKILQTNDIETRDTLDWLTSENILHKVPNSLGEWVLNSAVKDLLAPQQIELPSDGMQGWILYHLRQNGSATSRDIATGLRIERSDVTRVLRDLRSAQRVVIDPDGPQRGPGTRWKIYPSA